MKWFLLFAIALPVVAQKEYDQLTEREFKEWTAFAQEEMVAGPWTDTKTCNFIIAYEELVSGQNYLEARPDPPLDSGVTVQSIVRLRLLLLESLIQDLENRMKAKHYIKRVCNFGEWETMSKPMNGRYLVSTLDKGLNIQKRQWMANYLTELKEEKKVLLSKL